MPTQHELLTQMAGAKAVKAAEAVYVTSMNEVPVLIDRSIDFVCQSAEILVHVSVIYDAQYDLSSPLIIL